MIYRFQNVKMAEFHNSVGKEFLHGRDLRTILIRKDDFRAAHVIVLEPKQMSDIIKLELTTVT